MGGCAKHFTASARIFKSRTASRAAQKTDWRCNNLGLNKANDTGVVVKGWASLSELMLVPVVQSNTQVTPTVASGYKPTSSGISRLSFCRGWTDTREGGMQRRVGQIKHETWNGEVGRGGGKREKNEFRGINLRNHLHCDSKQDRGKTINKLIIKISTELNVERFWNDYSKLAEDNHEP